jgi:transposase
VHALRAELLRHALHADETPDAMLKAGAAKTPPSGVSVELLHDQLQRNPRWCSTLPTAAPQHAGTSSCCPRSLVCDEFSGYKACFEMGVTEAACLAYARRKFLEL